MTFSISITKALVRRELKWQAVYGTLWLGSQTVIGKVLGMTAQLLLAKYLLPDDFGLVGITFGCQALLSTVQQMGVREVVVRKAAKLDRWVNSSFWLCVSCGILTASIQAITAYPLARMFHDPRLFGLLLAASITLLLGPLPIVPMAILQARFRYRTLAYIGLVDSAGQMIFSVVLARAGYGAYSLILPRAMMHAIRFVLTMKGAAPRITSRMNHRRWRYLIVDNLWMSAFRAVTTIINNGDYLALGLFASKQAVGYYYFAFFLSMQTFHLTAATLDGILFPALTSVADDPTRQRAAFLRALSILSAIAVPVSLLQASVIHLVLPLCFGDKWNGAIHACELLSIGMSFRIGGWASQNALQSQGKFSQLTKISSIGALIFAGLVVPSSLLRGADGVAGAVMVYFFIESLGLVVFSLGIDNWNIYTLFNAVLRPQLVAGIAVCSGLCVAHSLEHALGVFGSLLVHLVVATILYLILMPFLMSDAFAELASIARPSIAKLQTALGLTIWT